MLAGSNPAEDGGFLRVKQVRSTTSFGGEVKPVAPCRKILRVEDSYSMEKILICEIQGHFSPLFFCYATRYLCRNQRARVDESGMIRTHMGTHNGSESGRSACDALYETTQ
jgi:hypothetical protein